MSPEDLKANYKLVFSSEEGQIVMNDLQRRCNLFAPVFSENTHEMAFKDGQRWAALFLINMLSEEPPPQQETTDEDN